MSLSASMLAVLYSNTKHLIHLKHGTCVPLLPVNTIKRAVLFIFVFRFAATTIFFSRTIGTAAPFTPAAATDTSLYLLQVKSGEHKRPTKWVKPQTSAMSPNSFMVPV